MLRHLYVFGIALILLTEADAQPSVSSPNNIGFFESILIGIGIETLTAGHVIGSVIIIALTILGDRVYIWISEKVRPLDYTKSSRSLFRLNSKKLYGHKILVLGSGGSGKTSVLNLLSHGAVGDSEKKTGKTQFFSFVHTLGVGSNEKLLTSNHKKANMIVCGADYKGQNPGELIDIISELTKSGREKITAVILIADISPAQARSDTRRRQEVPEIDKLRIEKQSGEWTESLFQILFTQLKNPPKVMIFYINAIDAVEKYKYTVNQPVKDSHRQEISDAHSQIAIALSKFSDDTVTRTIIGTTRSSITKQEIINTLEQHSVLGGAG